MISFHCIRLMCYLNKNITITYTLAWWETFSSTQVEMFEAGSAAAWPHVQIHCPSAVKWAWLHAAEMIETL